MNNKTIYSRRLEGYNNVKASYDREAASFEKWAKPRAIAHIFNARAVIKKHNHKERQRGGEQIVFAALPWMTDLIYDLRIESYHETSIKFSYLTSWTKAKQNTDRVTFYFPIKWLSFSTWDFNAQVRSDIKRELQRRDLNKKKAAEDQARKLRKQIWNAQAVIKKQTEELKKLEAVYSS